MTMKTCRRMAAALAGLTIICGGICKIFIYLPYLVTIGLSIGAILFGFSAILVVARFHRCPKCHKFIPITLRPETCVHCGEKLE